MFGARKEKKKHTKEQRACGATRHMAVARRAPGAASALGALIACFACGHRTQSSRGDVRVAGSAGAASALALGGLLPS